MHDIVMEDLKAVAERIKLVREQLLNTEHEKTALLNKLQLVIQKEEQLNEELSEESRMEKNMLKALAASISGGHRKCKSQDIKKPFICGSDSGTGNVTQLDVCDKINDGEFTSHNYFGNNASSDTQKSEDVIQSVSHVTPTVCKSKSKEIVFPVTSRSSNYSSSPLRSKQSARVSHSRMLDLSTVNSVASGDDEEIQSANGIISSEIKRKRKSIKTAHQNQKSFIKAVDNADNNRLHCDICKKVFKQHRSYKLHVRTHNKAATFSCSECDLTFTMHNQLKKHLRVHSKSCVFMCSQCDKDLKTSQRYDNHMRMHSGEKPFECAQCGKRFSLIYSLKTHQKLHSGTRDHLCSICGKGYVNNCELTKHIATHSLQYGCEVCGKRFAYFRRLEIHQLVHTDQCPFVCNVCGRAVRTSKALTVHLQTHYKIKVHACKICDRMFQQAGNLKAHLRTHTGESAFSCRECGQKFRNGYNLKIHLLTHTDALPTTFSCTVCRKKFIGRGILKAHLLTHFSETPHKCDECDKRYKRPVDLRIHKRKIHNSLVIKLRLPN